MPMAIRFRMFVPGSTRVQRWIPHRGAEFNQTTTSAYVQDRWVVSPQLTLNLGMRFEHASSEATTGQKSPGHVARRAAPRRGYDVNGNGETVLQATFSQYSGKYNAVQFSRNTNVGNSDRYTLSYVGPAGEGRSFAPGFDLNNYSGVVAGTFPALNVQFADDLSSPVTTEYTLGAARTFGARSYAKAVFVQRKTSNFIEEFILFANGKTPIVVDGATLGQLDNIVYDNSDEMKREYQALQFMGSAPADERGLPQRPLDAAAEERRQLRRRDAEPGRLGVRRLSRRCCRSRAARRRAVSTTSSAARCACGPTTSAGLGRYGSFTFAPIYRYNSARTYSLVLNGQPLSAVQAGRQSGLRRHAHATGLLRRAAARSRSKGSRWSISR